MKLIAFGLIALSAAVASAQSREVVVEARTVVPIQARLRFTTMIALPENEQILDFVCGDKDYWVISGANNLAYVKPAKAGASTNLNLVTASGRIYSFLLSEGTTEPDLNVYVLNAEGTPSASDTPALVPASRLEELRRELEAARTEVDTTRRAVASAIESGVAEYRAAYPTRLRFPYRIALARKPFYVNAIFHDGSFTYIRTAARELPSLYELRDGKPSLVNFQVQNGLFIVPKVLDRGYLAIGKERLTFESTER